MIEPQYCQLPETNKRETLPYYEYYLGEKDEQNRRHGVGQNCWTGPESIDWHHGHFLRDTMHGPGEYRSRYKRKPGLFLTYEGRLYVNRMHGYGVMSYPDGKVFTGLFNNDIRYGPGIESFADTTANVGLWRGTSLIRLAWRPLPAVAPEVAAWTGGRTMVEPHRAVLQTAFRTIDKVNKAVEYLKKHGSDPVSATGNWTRLYPKHCTDIDSRLCHVELFDYEYYNGKVYSLKECNSPRIDEDLEKESENSLEHSGAYYAWNNDPLTIDMMKHSFKHEKQRKEVHIDLGAVLSGPRTQFKPPAMHELDCRTLLMACYLGHVSTTTSMINEQGLDPNVTDVLGNSALMYAACGDQVVLITFLCDGGARVNSANDSCCTPLAVALIRLLCASRDVPSSGMMQAFLPPATGPANSEPPTILEWNINRETLSEPPKNTLGKVPSKITKTNMKVKSLTSFKDLPSPSKKNMDMLDENDFNTKLYRDVNNEYIIKVTDSLEPVSQPVTYLFELNNMINEINEELAKLAQPEKKDPKSKASKVLKEPTKPSKEAIWPSSQKDEDVSTMTSAEIRKAETCNRIKLTILTLLENGAKPSLVRCPQPALVMAILAGVPDLVDQLIHYGADVNEVYPQHLNYSPLDIAVSMPLNQTTLDLVQTLLMGGANADHRLTIPTASPREDPGQMEVGPGPTLLHYVLTRRVESEFEDDIRRQIIHLLLEYKCDPLDRYNGRSALDEATKRLDLLDIIIKNPKTDLNAPIDDSNQTILVKMFHPPYFKTLGNLERSQTLTNLLLFGADPLIACESEGVKYENLFVMVRKALAEMNPSGSKLTASPSPKKLEAKASLTKGKKPDPKKVDMLASDDIANLKQAVDLMTECSRIIYIRWLQTQLAKDIIQAIDRHRHRHWSMIIKECKNKKASGLWITAQRCLEIWGRLKTTRRKVYQDRAVLWRLLCIAHFFHLRSVTKYGFDKVTTAEKNEAESYASDILKENKKSPMVPLQRYVQPELFVKADAKFNVCFECFLPLTENRILCYSCKLVSFCNMDCLKESIEKSNGHACNDYLILKYFPEPPETVLEDEPMPNQPSVIK
ncbi:ankyrin repeat and MYND domain-containing protein 1-like isoform X1 [Leguminivora glycinivorella]|uniref:ankyrin repeat and MYND domain-containing protein 1-like isoform X1 n=1 Tax=Leguminivora glycinivorella TaxID=1035111 RepID=UPI00200D7F8D|nr:ankyrin repeat and MYND domain-containing protein 1-like isoform X1 [Leguminivora glycinivorella]